MESHEKSWNLNFEKEYEPCSVTSSSCGQCHMVQLWSVSHGTVVVSVTSSSCGQCHIYGTVVVSVTSSSSGQCHIVQLLSVSHRPVLVSLT